MTHQRFDFFLNENHTLLLAFALADKIASIKLTTTTAMLTSMPANSVQVFACG
jgi:alpha-D-ribose 1-methylphosphonate 5-triphosphate diphosphatase PhnM